MLRLIFAFTLFLGCAFAASPSIAPQQSKEAIAFFTPPQGWQLADSSKLAPSVRVMVVGKSNGPFPPSMNLSTQPYPYSLKKYLQLIKEKNKAEGYEWKDLGNIRTLAGNANLSQVDTKAEWGITRFMHVILLKEGQIYILTASALKDEFSLFYKSFFDAMTSLRIIKEVEDVLPTHEKKQFKSDSVQLKQHWNTMLNQYCEQFPDIDRNSAKEKLFASQEFQEKVWSPFKIKVEKLFGNQGAEWTPIALQKIEDDLFEIKN